MAGSTFGTIFKVTTWGESHGPAIGAVVDGCPAGLPLTEELIQPYMDRRKPGGALATKRREDDLVEILSGVFEGHTTGTPISLVIRNKDQHSKDYSAIKDIYRPGHADYGYDVKYGFRDYRGGGRSSGRETAGRVAAGAVACELLKKFGITFETRVSKIGAMAVSGNLTRDENPAVFAYIDELRERGDSIGSEVVCSIRGVPAGLGDPVFEKLDARLAGAVFSIGAVKAVGIGDGAEVSKMLGSENNDPFGIYAGEVHTGTNHAGGILGGISTGEEILLTVSFKPTPSISLPQMTVDRDHSETEIRIHGRHDPVIAPRAAVVVEAMSALVIADAYLLNRTARISSL